MPRIDSRGAAKNDMCITERGDVFLPFCSDRAGIQQGASLSPHLLLLSVLHVYKYQLRCFLAVERTVCDHN